MYFKYIRNILLSNLLLFLFVAGTTKFTGSPGGKTGSPSDDSNCTACHNSFNIINKDAWISTNIPESGYTPGNTYEIKIDAYHKGSVRIGFEITSETAGKKIGNWSLIDTIKTQFTNGITAVTHTAKGTVANDSVRWIMKWIAPQATTGDVVFYAAVNATNSDISSGGDQVYLTSTRVKEEGTAGIKDVFTDKNAFRLWPNPAADFLNISIKEHSKMTLVEIINLQGKVLKKINTKDKNTVISLTGIPIGVLFLKTYVDNKIYVQPFIKL